MSHPIWSLVEELENHKLPPEGTDESNESLWKTTTHYAQEHLGVFSKSFKIQVIVGGNLFNQ
ncbi:hypothetical protein HAX54_007176, partial [Datura stramonium]|nr:hypothetical protein [Datura stramonium]